MTFVPSKHDQGGSTEARSGECCADREQRAPVCDLHFFPALHLFILAYRQATGSARSLGVAEDMVGTSVLGLILQLWHLQDYLSLSLAALCYEVSTPKL